MLNKLIKIALCGLLPLILAACNPSDASFSEFKDFGPEGWKCRSPVYFVPEYGDSAACYELFIAVRYDNDFAFKRLNLAVDLLDSLNNVQRRSVSVPIVNEHGKRLGSGFGGVYQQRVSLVDNLPAFAVKKIVVWQTVQENEPLTHLNQLGVMILKK